jgi:hypothetical protein
MLSSQTEILGRKRTMWKLRTLVPSANKIKMGSLLFIGVLTLGSTFGFSSRPKSELIKISAMGTGTQMGQRFSIALDIYGYSTPADRQILSQAFEKGQNQGLVSALSKMKAMGFLSISKTVGYNVSYIQMVQTPTGRKIQFITDRALKFGETYFDKQSEPFNLAAGEVDLNDADKSKSTGSFYPESKLAIDNQGQLKFDLVAYPWKLLDIVDWKGTPEIN